MRTPLEDYTIPQYESDSVIIVDRGLTVDELLEIIIKHDVEVVILDSLSPLKRFSYNILRVYYPNIVPGS